VTDKLIDICDFDITLDLPVGILHALSLGPAKYLASVTKATLDAAALDNLQVYMEAAPTASLYDAKQLNAAYMIKHANSLVGKELKVLAQTASGFLAPLLARGVISQGLWQSWYTLGQLARILLVEQVAECDRQQYMVSIKLMSSMIFTCTDLHPTMFRQMFIELYFTSMMPLLTSNLNGLPASSRSMFWLMLWIPSPGFPC
jgi:hypothetical protein